MASIKQSLAEMPHVENIYMNATGEWHIRKPKPKTAPKNKKEYAAEVALIDATWATISVSDINEGKYDKDARFADKTAATETVNKTDYSALEERVGMLELQIAELLKK